MYKIYTIRPKIPQSYSRLPKEYQVIFQWSKMQLGASRTQIVTTCLFRNGIEVVAGGVSIENPLDERDENNELGIQWSFKRAIPSLLRNFGYTNAKRKKLEKSFRLAFYNARKEK